MTDVFSKPGKVETKRRLFDIAQQALVDKGWTVARAPDAGKKSSIRRITRGTDSKLAAIRTTQDQWLAFGRSDDGKGWNTLDDVDVVVAASVDDRENPRLARVHLLEANVVRARFDRAYAARKKAGFVIPKDRGVWVSLYEEEAKDRVSHVGAGIARDDTPIAEVALAGVAPNVPAGDLAGSAPPLTIAQAKLGLAKGLGVPESAIEITIRH